MNAKALFGRYWEADSPIHNLDPRTKLLGTLALVVTLFLASNWLAMGFAAAVIVVLFAVARIPLSQAARSVAPILFIVILAVLFNIFFVQGGQTLFEFGFIKISEQGFYTAAFMGLRLTLLLLLGSLLTMTTTSIDITEASEVLLTPFARFGLPAHEFAFVMGTALRFLPQFADEFHAIRIAQISRGAKLATSPLKGVSALTSLIVPLFTSVFRHADTLSAAMDARCYHGANGRTRLNPLRFHKRDAVAAFLVAVILIAVVILSRL